MKISNFSPVDPTMGTTRTLEHFSKYLGYNPHRLGLMARLYEQYTSLYITEAVSNIFALDQKKNDFQSINSLMFEWEIQTSIIKKIPFAASPVDTSGEGGEVTMSFAENYYQKYDIFVIDGSGQHMIVVSRPIRKSDGFFDYQCRLVTNDLSIKLDVSKCQRGDTTHWISNAHPELSEEGYTKRISNIEKHRNYITTFRNDESWSSLYAIHEKAFVTISDERSGVEKYLQLNGAERDLFDSFMYARGTGLLWNKCNVDASGRPTIQDPDTNRPIYIGDGAIPQVERYASKQVYNRFSENVLNNMLTNLANRAEQPTGNKFLVTVNNKLWQDINSVLSKMASVRHDDTLIWSRDKNGYCKVGATFQSYELAGNVVTFKPDKALSMEKGDEKGYGVAFDITPDLSRGRAAINMFTLKKGQFITGEMKGLGGLDGVTSGEMSTKVAGSYKAIMGYAGIGVMNPYRGFILMEA